MRDLTLRFAVTSGLVLLAFQSLVVAQKTADSPPSFKTSIIIDSAKLAANKPAIVTITVENVSGREIELSSSCSLDLSNLSKEAVSRKYPVVGDSYWGPVNISNSTPVKHDIIDPEKLKQGVVVGRVPKFSLQFAKDETKTFKVDLTKLFWNDSMRSMWPSETLFKVVPRGLYSLTFVINAGGKNLKSNGVTVAIN